jgi:hypothetical protein
MPKTSSSQPSVSRLRLWTNIPTLVINQAPFYQAQLYSRRYPAGRQGLPGRVQPRGCPVEQGRHLSADRL